MAALIPQIIIIPSIIMRIHWSSSFLIPFIAFQLLAQEAPVTPPAAPAEPPAAVAKPQPPPPPPIPPEEQDVDLTSMMMFLKPDSVVMKVGTMDVKWSEVQPWIRFQQQKAQRNNQTLDTKDLLKNLRLYLIQLASRGLFLQEAKALGLTVTEENKKDFEHELEQILKLRKQDKEEYMRRFDVTVSRLSKLSLDDTLLVIKLDKEKFKDLTLTDQEKAVCRQYLNTINNNVKKQNEQRQQALAKLAEDPEVKTDEGFAKNAKEVSEGTESARGGELDYDFDRDELAQALELPSFDWKVGETTPLLESSSSYRIMRVLRELPVEKEGDKPKIRVAQILIGKLATQPTDDEALRVKFLPNKKKNMLAAYAQELSKKYPVTTVFFPNGLWPKQ
ncbi:MAG: peptidylprolyl isomerase [Victivallales bacterium]|nr:peptidylprolyl isomerase [Victivallales bacterium]